MRFPRTPDSQHSRHCHARRSGKTLLVVVVALLLIGLAGGYVLYGKQEVARQRAITNNRLKMLGLQAHNVYDAGIKPTREKFPPDLLDEVEPRCEILWDAFPERLADVVRDDSTSHSSRTGQILIAYEQGADQQGGYGLFLDGRTEVLPAEEITRLIDEALAHTHWTQESRQQSQIRQDLANENLDPVAVIEALGGSVQLEYAPKSVRLGEGDDSAMPHVGKLTGVQILDLGFSNLTDAGLQHIRGLTTVERLDLQRTKVAGPGLVHLADMTHLQDLLLGSTPLTDAALAHLTELPALAKLNLSQTRIGDEGLAHLQGIGSLQKLDLSFTQVTDKGLQTLAAMTNLQQVILLDAKVTDEGVKRLHENRPQLKIFYQFSGQ